jgi:hypothetical protein
VERSWTFPAAAGLYDADIKTLYQTIFNLKDVVYLTIREQTPVEIVHDLMNPDNGFPAWTVREFDRLDVWIDHRPLPRPITPYRLAPSYVAAFHAICPHDILMHRREDGLHVASVEPVIDMSKKRTAILCPAMAVHVRGLVNGTCMLGWVGNPLYLAGSAVGADCSIGVPRPGE